MFAAGAHSAQAHNDNAPRVLKSDGLIKFQLSQAPAIDIKFYCSNNSFQESCYRVIRKISHARLFTMCLGLIVLLVCIARALLEFCKCFC